MRPIDADDFINELMDQAITDEQRDFTERVKFAIQKQNTLKVIPIEWITKWQQQRADQGYSIIESMKRAWKREYESGKNIVDHSGERIGDVPADSPAFDADRTAEDRGMCTPEGVRKDGLLCVPETAGRRKGTQGDLLKKAVGEIDNVLSTLEPVESLNVARDQTENINELLKLIVEKSGNRKTVNVLAEGAQRCTKKIDAEMVVLSAVIKTIIKNMPYIRRGCTE